jgi:hypothetical protein
LSRSTDGTDMILWLLSWKELELRTSENPENTSQILKIIKVVNWKVAIYSNPTTIDVYGRKIIATDFLKS